MRIEAIAYQPYVYNTNAVSAASLNRISALPEDGTKRRTDFSEPDGQENVNPLGKGQSANFMDILSSQMAMSRSKSAMLLGSARQGAGVQEADEPEEDSLQGQSAAEMADDLMAEQMQEDKADEALTTAAAGGGETGSAMNESAGGSYTSYQMRYALDAYSMAMGFVA